MPANTPMTADDAIDLINKLHCKKLDFIHVRLIKELWANPKRTYASVMAQQEEGVIFIDKENSLIKSANNLFDIIEEVFGEPQETVSKGNFKTVLETQWRSRQSQLNGQIFSTAKQISNEVTTQLNDLSQSVSNSKFSSLIIDKTQDFVGREYIFEAIKKFINDYDKGYLTITGDPGQGKSAILAKYVQDTNCITHFNSSLEGPNRTDQFLESICDQLIKRYQLPYNSLPPNATRDGVFLKQLLEESAKKRNGQPIIIAVDALDEVDRVSNKDSLANILFLPPYLPDDVYFILTKRRGVDVPFTVYTPFKELSLLNYQTDSERDVRTYIKKRINGSGELRLQIAERGETIEDFTNKISDKSENNFIYLRFVLLGIEKGEYKKETLEKFPKGLENYYEFHWRQMAMNDEKIKIVYILGEVRQSVSRQQICEFSGENSRVVQSVLREWDQFLHTLQKNGLNQYIPYHPSFKDFLHRKDILEKTGITIPGINQLIVNSLTKGLFDDENI
jgi:hypothetical protein